MPFLSRHEKKRAAESQQTRHKFQIFSSVPICKIQHLRDPLGWQCQWEVRPNWCTQFETAKTSARDIQVENSWDWDPDCDLSQKGKMQKSGRWSPNTIVHLLCVGWASVFLWLSIRTSSCSFWNGHNSPNYYKLTTRNKKPRTFLDFELRACSISQFFRSRQDLSATRTYTLCT